MEVLRTSWTLRCDRRNRGARNNGAAMNVSFHGIAIVILVVLPVGCAVEQGDQTEAETDQGPDGHDQGADEQPSEPSTDGSNGDHGSEACFSPPADVCVDSSTLFIYIPQGVVTNGECSYKGDSVFCENGCKDGTCKGNPCAGMPCLSPPENTCADGSTLTSYDPTGKCANGTCSYEASSISCEHGCDNGACNGDPCAGMVCSSPPESTCADSFTLAVYASTGTCADGVCSYTDTTQPCPHGCVDGACRTPTCESAGSVCPNGLTYDVCCTESTLSATCEFVFSDGVRLSGTTAAIGYCAGITDGTYDGNCYGIADDCASAPDQDACEGLAGQEGSPTGCVWSDFLGTCLGARVCSALYTPEQCHSGCYWSERNPEPPHGHGFCAFFGNCVQGRGAHACCTGPDSASDCSWFFEDGTSLRGSSAITGYCLGVTDGAEDGSCTGNGAFCITYYDPVTCRAAAGCTWDAL
jgi:hypothetical protein